jgi:hypothetical protein
MPTLTITCCCLSAVVHDVGRLRSERSGHLEVLRGLQGDLPPLMHRCFVLGCLVAVWWVGVLCAMCWLSSCSISCGPPPTLYLHTLAPYHHCHTQAGVAAC